MASQNIIQEYINKPAVVRVFFRYIYVISIETVIKYLLLPLNVTKLFKTAMQYYTNADKSRCYGRIYAAVFMNNHINYNFNNYYLIHLLDMFYTWDITHNCCVALKDYFKKSNIFTYCDNAKEHIKKYYTDPQLYHRSLRNTWIMALLYHEVY